MRICNIHAPVRQRKVKTRCKPSPWLSHDIVKLIHKRHVLHKRAAKSKHQADWLLYKKARNDVIYAVRNCMRVYFARKIKLNSGNKKNIWKLLKQVLPSSKTPLIYHLLWLLMISIPFSLLLEKNSLMFLILNFYRIFLLTDPLAQLFTVKMIVELYCFMYHIVNVK